jgi:hypothetical protein
VLVVVIAIGCVPVPVVGVVHMIFMRDRLVATAGSVRVRVARVGQVRQRVLIVVALVRCVGMPFMDVVDMALALRPRVAAAGPVLVRVLVGLMLVCHGSSLL